MKRKTKWKILPVAITPAVLRILKATAEANESTPELVASMLIEAAVKQDRRELRKARKTLTEMARGYCDAEAIDPRDYLDRKRAR
jgi:hypothetical protein